MSQGYQLRDREVVDYRLWQARPDGDWLRGPPPPSLAPGSYFACVGAAQTFGCFVARPWPQLLSERLELPALNLGVAGAGPALFRTPQFRPLLANARFVVFQVLSGRSADCSRFESGGRERLRVRADGRVLGADEAWREVLQGSRAGRRRTVWRAAANRLHGWFGHSLARRLVAETRADWLSQFTALLRETSVPKLLLWWSRRAPSYRARFHSVPAMFGEFPQLVDERLVRAVAAHADGFVECITARGSPQTLRSAATGEPTTVRPADAGTGEAPSIVWTHNHYYPSPEMHEDAAWALLGPARQLARAGSAGAPA